jgi:lipopolysaccharide/colanic/teichoic acid biosynthesis glycosyltransferase
MQEEASLALTHGPIGVDPQGATSPTVRYGVGGQPTDSRHGRTIDLTMVRLAARITERNPTGYERYVKPTMDRVVAAMLLMVLAPVMLLSALAVFASVGRPLLLWQSRIGHRGVPFRMWKFRTMHPDRRGRHGPYDGPDRRMTHKSLHDPRHTRVGRMLRKLSIDELPQLVNVLKGEMSLVGPRPELAVVAESYLPWQRTRHTVKPGVTGLWQTTARGEGRLLHDCIDLDLRYIEQLSFRRDIAIMLRTPVALLRNRGVI